MTTGGNLNPQFREPDADFDYTHLNILTNRFRDPRIVQQEMEQAMARLGRVLIPRLRADTPIGATGELAASTTGRLHTDVTLAGSTSVTLTITQPAQAGAITTTAQLLGISGIAGSTPIALTQTPYRPFASLGRGPGANPPYQRLVPWVIEKNFLPAGSRPSRFRQIAYFISRKIGAFGSYRYRTRAIPYAQITLDRSAGYLQQTAQDISGRVVGYVTDNINKGVRR